MNAASRRRQARQRDVAGTRVPLVRALAAAALSAK
jgi:hypothetical protein